MVISPLNHMFWRSVVESILIDHHMLFYGELLVFMQKVVDEDVCMRHTIGVTR